MDQSRALNALAPFVALAKSANSPRAAADLITQATSAPNTYVFAELLQQPNVQSLKGNAQYGNVHTLLELFAWGTWEDYKSTANLPSLSDAQSLKLRLLSLLSYASNKPTASSSGETNLSYTSLCRRLDLASSIDLEHLITQAIYSNLVTATLNPENQAVVITSTAPLRDLAPGSLQSMCAELEAWSGRCDDVLASLESEMRKVRAAATQKSTRERRAEKQIRTLMETNGIGESAASDTNRKAGWKTTTRRKVAKEEADDDDEDAMDVDSNGVGDGGNKRKGPAKGSFAGRGQKLGG